MPNLSWGLPATPAARRALLIGGGVLVLLALLYGTAAATAGGKVPRGTSVLGVEIGGRTPDAAKEQLQLALADRASTPITVVADGKQLTVDPAAAGLSVDVDATVAAAGTVSKSPVVVLRLFSGSREVEPVLKVDTTKLDAEMTRIAAEVDAPGADGGITYNGTTPVAVAPKNGRTLDKSGAADTIRSAFLRLTGPVELPVEETSPKVTQAEVDRAMAKAAQPAVAAPVKVDAAGTAFTITPAQIAKYLAFVPDEAGTLVPKLDAVGLRGSLGDAAAKLERKPKDASFDVSGGSPKVIPAVAGTGLDAQKLADGVLSVLTQPAPRTVSVALSETQPRLTTEAAQNLGVVEKIGEFTTYHPCCAARVTNIHKIADIVRGHVVLPGETFSLNGLVGERDRARGFVEAPMIQDGLYVDSVGGGISQFATTIFNAVFFSGLQDVKHQPHSYWISRYPAGRESTISFPEPDFKFKNDSPNGVLIHTSYTNTSITVTFWGTKRYDIESISGPRTNVKPFGTRYNPKPGCESASGKDGFDIEVWRVFKQGGKEVKRERFFTRYLPEPHIICGAKPSATPPPPSSSPTPNPPPVEPSSTPSPTGG